MGLFIAAGISGLFCGCAHSSQQTLNSLWTSVTPRQWSANPADKPPEPRVSANIPDAEPLSEHEVPKQLAGEIAADEPPRTWGLFPSRTRSQEVAQTGAEGSPSEAKTSGTTSVASDDSKSDATLSRLNPPSLQRLRTALTLGFEGKTDTTSTTPPGQDQVRLRVESLLSRSRALADNGELPQANHLAQLAQQMAEEAKLEFAPDAQRPVDVIAFLDQQTATQTVFPKDVAAPPGDSRTAEPNSPTLVMTGHAAAPATAGPALITANAVMRVNQGFSTSDAQAQVEPAKVVTETDGQLELLPALAGVDFVAGTEPARDDARELTGIAAVRERFRAHEAAGSRSSEPQPTTVPTSPPRVPETVTSITWTWPSLVETRTVPQHQSRATTAMITGAIGLATLAAGVWIAASRRRRRPA
jgi:hypothetical protein